MANTALIDTLEDMIEADLGRQVFEMLPSVEIEPAMEGIPVTSEGVSRFSDLSQGYLVRKVISSGMAGQFKWDAVDEDTMTDLTGATPARSHTLATRAPDSRYPSPTNLPGPAIIQVSVPLTVGRGTIAFPSEYLRSDRLDSALARYTELMMKGMAKNIALLQADSFFMPANGTLATVLAVDPDSGGYDGNASAALVCTVTAGRIFRFEDGMLLDFYTNSGGTWTQKNVDGSGSPVRGVVDGVDYVNERLRVVFDTTLASAVAADDYIILEDTYVDASTDYARKGPMGIEDMLKAATTASQNVMSPNNSSSYGFNLAKYPKFGSKLVTVSGVLDEVTLNKYIGQFIEATGIMLDTIVTTRGVINKFSEYPMLYGGRQVWERQGQALQFTSGRGEVKVNYEGQGWTMRASRFVASGTLYGYKKNDNFEMVVPPRMPKAGSKETELGPPIEFVGPSLGYTSNFIPVLVSSTHVEMVQAPFKLFYQMVCETPQGIKLSSITED